MNASQEMKKITRVSTGSEVARRIGRQTTAARQNLGEKKKKILFY